MKGHLVQICSATLCANGVNEAGGGRSAWLREAGLCVEQQLSPRDSLDVSEERPSL